jgi:hypothetical protein
MGTPKESVSGTDACPAGEHFTHLIHAGRRNMVRDLNEDLLKHPYDDFLKSVIGDFAGWQRTAKDSVSADSPMELRGANWRKLCVRQVLQIDPWAPTGAASYCRRRTKSSSESKRGRHGRCPLATRMRIKIQQE